MQIEAIAVVDKDNRPIFIKNYSESPSLKYHFISNCCLDVILERETKNNYLGFLLSMEDVGAFGYITNTKTKFIIMSGCSDKSIRDSTVMKLFTEIHDAYVKMCFNVFYDSKPSTEYVKVMDKIALENRYLTIKT